LGIKRVINILTEEQKEKIGLQRIKMDSLTCIDVNDIISLIKNYWGQSNEIF